MGFNMQGRVFSYIHFNGQVGSLVKIATVTDFAARTDEFMAFGKDIAMQIAMTNPQAPYELLEEPSIRYDGASVQSLFDDISKKLGEKVELVIFQRFDFKKD